VLLLCSGYADDVMATRSGKQMQRAGRRVSSRPSSNERKIRNKVYSGVPSNLLVLLLISSTFSGLLLLPMRSIHHHMMTMLLRTAVYVQAPPQ
jgi:hypothetical protein